MKDLLYTIPDLETMSIDELKSLSKEINSTIEAKENQKYKENFNRVLQTIDYMAENYGSYIIYYDSKDYPITWADLKESIEYYKCC